MASSVRRKTVAQTVTSYQSAIKAMADRTRDPTKWIAAAGISSQMYDEIIDGTDIYPLRIYERMLHKHPRLKVTTTIAVGG